MSLLRQLVLIISMIFLIVFAGTLLISVNNTRVYLTEQMESHSQDTATSLALSITPAMKSQDWATVNSMVDAIFDRGYYRELNILSMDGMVLLERKLPVRIEGVPPWFVNLIPLETPPGEALITVDWKQAGKVLVRSHPGYAYNELWHSTVATLQWFVASWIIAMLLVIIVLRYALASLKAVEDQALAISAREFPVIEKLPWTRELHRVVAAMNKMSVKVKTFIEEQVELTGRIQGEAYKDPVTGLANRNFFETRLQYLLDTPDEFPGGALLLVQLSDLKGYNDRYGLEKGDELLKQTARIIEDTGRDTGEKIIARLGGGNFAILAQLTTPPEAQEEAQELGGRICQGLASLHMHGLTDSLCAGHVGIAYYEPGKKQSDLFSEADMALRAAQQKGPNAWHMYERTLLKKDSVHGATHWQEILRQVMATRGITLFSQHVVSCVDKVLMHHEVFARIADRNGNLIPASVFIPMAERFGMACDLDKLVVEKVLSYLRLRPQAKEIMAINIFSSSIYDPAFADWLSDLLKDHPDAPARIIFEASEYGCTTRLDSLRHFVDTLSATGIRFSLDHFGVGFTPFGYLQDVRPDYIKIDGSLIRNLHQKRDNQFFLQSLIEIAHGLDIRVIAESVEDQQEWDVLKTMHVDGVQGYLSGEPRIIE